MRFKVRVRLKGGPGSGHHGHEGRPGKVGGSAPGKGGGAKGAWAKRGVELYAGKHLTSMRGGATIDEWSDVHEKAANTVLSEIEYLEDRHPEVGKALKRAQSKSNYVMRNVGIEVDNSKPASGDSQYGMGLVLRVRNNSDFSGDNVILPQHKGRKLLNQHTYTSGQIRGTIRHEYAHILQEDPKWKSMKWSKMWKGLSPGTRSISRRARDHYKEGWAESFAMYTSRNYEVGMLPAPIEDFLGQYLSSGIEEKQLPIDDASKRKLFDVRLNVFYKSSDALAEQVYIGAIDIGAWEVEMRSLIKEMYTSASAIGKGGWDAMTFRDWGRLGTPVREQYKYLRGFAADILARAEDVTLPYIRARARMYGNSAGYVAELMQASKDLLQHLPWLPKDGSTECLTNCKCFWELRVIATKKTFKTVRATWRLRPAEHCEDCVSRNGHIETFDVHRDTKVPPILGGF